MTSLKVNPLHYLIFSPIIITMPSRHTAYPQSKPPLISLLQICSISALSLHKKQSSTYNKYACGCFLCAPSIYTAYLQKGLDRVMLSSIISQLTAHSSQLTAHSSQLTFYLDNFLSTFHRHYYLFSLYTQKQTAKYVIHSKDSAIHLGPTQLLIMNYEFIISFNFHSALYRSILQPVWSNTG